MSDQLSRIASNMTNVFERGLVNGIPYRRFGKTEWSVSSIGLGCSPLGDLYGNLPHSERLNIVKFAFDSGINILDTSPFYGETKSESNLGVCLHELSKDSSKLYERDQYHICSKVGRYSWDKHDYSAKIIEQSIQHSLQRLQTDYIDIISVHDLEFVGFYPDDDQGSLEQICNETLPALEEQKRKGIIGHYGLSGRPLIVLDYVARNYGYEKISTLLTYNNYNLTDERLLNFMPRLRKYDIGIMQGGYTLQGLLTPQGPQKWNNAPQMIKDKCVEASKICYDKTDGTEDEKRLAILRLSFLHAIDNVNIGSILVGPTSVEQLERNINWIRDQRQNKRYDDFLMQEDKDLIDELQHGVFADIMNLGWFDDGTQYNVCEATFESSHWKDVLHYVN